MRNDKSKAAKRVTASAAAMVLFVMCDSSCHAQVTPTSEVDAEPTELGETLPPAIEGKMGLSAFAIRKEAACSPKDCGLTTILSDGSAAWTATFHSTGATSMSLEIDSEPLPAGGELTVWGDGEAIRVSAETGVTPIVDGESITIQYTGPADGLSRFAVSAANCGFRRIGPSTRGNKALGYGDSQNCEVGAACNGSADDARRGVCRLIINNRNVGTGTLINNTAQDRAPLVLTSAHVVAGNTLRSCTALFGFEEPLCHADGYYVDGTDEIEGADLVAFDAATDMAVVRLSRAPGMACSPYWAGWSKSLTTGSPLTCVHHPNGDVKKASTAASATPGTTYKTNDKNATGGAFKSGIFWNVGAWVAGATEGGSSGSALLNSDGLVIGALSGGEASCRSPKNDWFWMLSEAWDASSDGYATLGNTLDPGGLGLTSLEGIGGVKTKGGCTKTLMTYDPRGDVADEQEKLSANVAELAQGVTSPAPGQEISIWAIRLYSTGDFESSNSKATVSAGISTSLGTEARRAAAAPVGTIGTERAADFVFDTPVVISAADNFFVRISLGNAMSEDYLTLATQKSDNGADSVFAWQDGEWKPLNGIALAIDIIYTQGEDTAQNEIRAGDLRIRCRDGVATLTGEAMGCIDVFRRDGVKVWHRDAKGRTEVEIDLCGKATGVYLIRATCLSGREKTFKVVNI
ncbi:MAG: serine protease [Bacteroidales bacterium]|nr:serine protease [Bacteroidales bacterium]